MAIRPVDLQSALVGAQANATILRNAEEAPAIAQSASNAAFAAQVQKRETTIEKTGHASGNKVRARGESERDASQEEAFEQQAHGQETGFAFEEPAPQGLGLAGEGQHFIDVTA